MRRADWQDFSPTHNTRTACVIFVAFVDDTIFSSSGASGVGSSAASASVPAIALIDVDRTAVFARYLDILVHSNRALSSRTRVRNLLEEPTIWRQTPFKFRMKCWGSFVTHTQHTYTCLSTGRAKSFSEEHSRSRDRK